MAESEGRNIVIAMDGSEYADNALDWYLKNIHKANDHVTLVHCQEYHAVMHTPSFGIGEVMVEADMAELLQEESKRLQELMTKLGKKLKTAGIAGKVKSVSGSPGEVLVRVAEEEKAVMIVTGTRGLGTLMGSVSDYILHHSHVPVAICRHKDHHHIDTHLRSLMG